MKKLIIGSRGSDLALWQANHVKKQLEELGTQVEIEIIKTQGDEIQHLSFDKMEGKGFFTKEIEEALLQKQIDLAVHSHKDLETTSPDGLQIIAVSERENPSDILLIRKESIDQSQVFNLKLKAVVGTSSARRKTQLLKFRPDTTISDLRGNVPTRIEKLRNQQYDAILVAKAGVDRLNLNLNEFHVEVLNPTEFVPAPAQGVLGLQIRSNDKETAALVSKLNHPQVQQFIAVEREVMRLLNGGCQLPLGVYCENKQVVYVSYSSNAVLPAKHFSYPINDLKTIAQNIVLDLKQY